MILCETARDGRTDAEHLAIFASQLAALGLPARIDVGALPEHVGEAGTHPERGLGRGEAPEGAYGHPWRLAGEAAQAQERPVAELIGGEERQRVAGREPAVGEQRRQVELQVQPGPLRHRADVDPCRQPERGELACEDRQVLGVRPAVAGGLTEDHGGPART